MSTPTYQSYRGYFIMPTCPDRSTDDALSYYVPLTDIPPPTGHDVMKSPTLPSIAACKAYIDELWDSIT